MSVFCLYQSFQIAGIRDRSQFNAFADDPRVLNGSMVNLKDEGFIPENQALRPSTTEQAFTKETKQPTAKELSAQVRIKLRASSILVSVEYNDRSN